VADHQGGEYQGGVKNQSLLSLKCIAMRLGVELENRNARDTRFTSMCINYEIGFHGQGFFMPGRVKIPDDVVAKLLVATRRRCCLCFFLDDDKGKKRVQIAHIDQKRSNNDPGNLVPLCLDHHDEYDSITSQSKGITRQELAAYKEKLVRLYQDDVPSIERITIEDRDIPDLSTSVFYGYGVLFSEISRILFKYDPIDINFGDNTDEYDPEAHDIIGMLQNNGGMTTPAICKKVFSKWFSPSLARGFSDYSNMGKEIDGKWEHFKERNYIYSGSERRD
jgi:hypothetical protein